MSDRERVRQPHRGAATFQAVPTCDGETWDRTLARVYRHDFHHLAGYHRVAEWHKEGTATLFVHQQAEYVIAVPLLIRPVDPGDPAGLQDATSVYGYAGPVSSHEQVPAHVIAEFQASLRAELIRRRVVTVFSRLHPLLDQRGLLEGLGEVVRTGLTVSVDLTAPLDDQWAGYTRSCRRVIRRSHHRGVVCSQDLDGRHWGAWASLYAETMDRVGADAAYRFDDVYFDVLADQLGPVLHLFVAQLGDEVIAAGLYTLCDGIVQAHLGASRSAYARLSPTRMLDDAVRRWGAASGASVFHLGGGVGGSQDSLFEYKASFSDRRHEFLTWRWVVDPVAYARLSGPSSAQADVAGGASPVDSFFPAYRRPAPFPERRAVRP